MKLTFIMFEHGAGTHGDQARATRIGNSIIELHEVLVLMFVKIPTGVGWMTNIETAFCSKKKKM
jgi:hypothetical protein